MSEPWVEKYRPKTLDQITAQQETVQVLMNSLKTENLPHLLFYGPPGTGKTSTCLALCREMYGSEFKSRVLELNASDERGIDVVRDKIKNFAKLSVKNDKLPPYKIVILDEADSMTQDAQSALRRTMETYSKITRFCIICNYLSKIIDPLASRCAKFRFQPLQKQESVDRLRYICQMEQIEATDDGLEALVDIAEGDLRQAITLLQSGHSLNPVLNKQVVYDMTGTIPQSLMDRIMTSWQSKNAQQVQQALQHLFSFGYSGSQLLHQMHKLITGDSQLSSLERSKYSVLLAHCEKKMLDGADEQLQLLHLLTSEE
ncbi:P-loop containing nucleoside triphosphate hydrolase protein [Gorgonomyces haynaldii]|nr:P-loop containing nucleoside triphosphate hydrolase protein [Gorgonomyces haynaldii]